jgi:hypothetical protein
MSIYSWVTIIALIITILIFAKLQKLKKNLFKILVAASLLYVLAPLLIPRQIFGNWDALKKLNGRQVKLIILRPSSPGWKVNLTKDAFRIVDSRKIDSIVNLLHQTQPDESSHPMRIWETDMVFFTIDDSLILNVQKNDYNKGTTIDGGDPHNELRQDKLGSYLEIITDYKTPFQ